MPLGPSDHDAAQLPDLRQVAAEKLEHTKNSLSSQEATERVAEQRKILSTGAKRSVPLPTSNLPQPNSSLEKAAGGEDVVRVEGGFETTHKRKIGAWRARDIEALLERGRSEEKRGMAPVGRGGTAGTRDGFED